MLHLEAIEDRLLLSSVLSVASIDVGNLSTAAAPAGTTSVPIATPSARGTRDVSLVSFTLFNPRTNESLGQLFEGETIDLATLPKQGLGIRADSEAHSVGSVVFGYDGNTDYHVENYLPYTLIGAGQSTYYSWTPTVGQHTVIATGFSSQNGTGAPGDLISVDFNVINTAAVTSFTLMDADNNQPLGTLIDGQTINLAALPTQNLTIVATPTPGIVGSVVFDYDGQLDYHHENFSPYALVGKTWDGFHSWTPSVGAHTLTATPYPGIRGHGSGGTPLTIGFNVIDTPAASVTSFSLVDNDNGETLTPIVEGQTIDLATLPTLNLSIVATTDTTAGSVVFGYDGNSAFQVQDTAPYALSSWNPVIGSHTITATAYSDLDGGGAAGTPLNVDFTVTDSMPVVTAGAPSITGFNLVDFNTSQNLGSLVEGETIDLATLASKRLSIVATTDITAGSVVFGYDGNASFQVQDLAPYAVTAWSPVVGAHTLTATAFSGLDGSGAGGLPVAVDFNIINSNTVVTPPPPAVTGFTLIDNDNGQTLGPLVEGETIDLASLPSKNLSVVASTVDASTGSIIFGYDSNAAFETADTAPYTLTPWTPVVGAHTITATPYSALDGNGNAGVPIGVDFTVVDSSVAVSPVPAITGFNVIDTDNGQFLGSLAEGQTLDLGTLPTQDLTLVAIPSVPGVGSVVFGYDSNANAQVADAAPYSLGSWTATPGVHTVTATPFSGADGTGISGTPMTVDFTIIDSTAVSSFVLVNTDNNQVLESLNQGQTIDLATLPTKDLAIAATTTDTVVGSVLFGYDGNPNFFLQNGPSSPSNAWVPTLGSHTITATPYSAADAGGLAGAPLSVDFTVINSSAATSFSLIDTDNGQSLGAITPGETIDLASLPTLELSIVASTTPTSLGSVIFGYDGTVNAGVENTAPYTLSPWTPVVGNHTITATPYSAADAAGFAGAPLSVNFTVINSEAVTGFTLVNSDNGQSLGSLSEGQTIDLHTLPTQNIAIIATTSISTVGSVVFGFDNNANDQLDNAAPYVFNSWTATVGAHTITATPYFADNGGAPAGTPLKVDFKVIDSTPLPPPVTNSAISVSITNPINGESQAGPGYYVIRTATSDTAGAISKVDFYVNGNLLGTADAAPFSMAWENATPGSYILTAVASDSAGGTTSAPVNVTITPLVTARTIFVSTNGNNSNNGLSLDNALQTISAAAKIAQPGDTVLIEPGTYPETVVVTNGGTPTQPITFQAAVPGTVIIDGADPLGGWTASAGANPVFTTAWNHDFFRNGSRTFFGPSTDGTTTAVGYAEQFLYNNQPLKQVVSASSLAAGDFFVDYSARTVSVWLPGGATPSSSNMLASSRNHLFVAGSTSVQYVRVDGLIFQHASNFAQDAAVLTATGWRVLNSTIQDVNTTAAAIKGSDVLFYNDHALNNGETGFNGSGTNDLLVFDETAGNNYKGFSVFNEAGGGKFAQSDGLYFDQYFAHNNVGPGLWFDFKNTNYVVVNSYFYNNQPHVANYEGMGLQIEINEGPGRVQNDTFYGNTGAGLEICESMNVTVSDNTFHNSYLDLRDLPNRDPYHIQNIHILDNDFDNSFISTDLGTWTTTSPVTKQIFIDGDTFNKSGPIVYWGGTGYSSLSSISSILGLENNGKLGVLSFTPAPLVV